MIERLRADGWVEGRNIALEYRFDESKRERLAALAVELVNLKVSAIVAVSTPAALAAKRATATIPIRDGPGRRPCTLWAGPSRP